MINKFIKNIDSVTHTYEGQEILAGQYYKLTDISSSGLSNSSDLISDITNSKAMMARDSSGNNDIADINEQINFLKGNESQVDSDGALMSRQKIVRTGWHYQGLFACLTTASGVISSRYKDKSNINFWSVKRYDASDVEVTSAPWTNVVRTVFAFGASHDIAIMGVKLWQAAVPTTQTELWIHGAPHIPLNLGGSVAFVQGGMDLSHMGSGLIAELDGKAPKDILYDSLNLSHKFELELIHSAGEQHTFQVMFEYFKPMGV